MTEIAKVVDLPTPVTERTRLFRCSAPGFMSTLLGDAGFEILADDDVAVAATVDSPETFWVFLTDVAAAVVAGLAMADDTGRERIRAATIAAMRGYESDGKLLAPGLARVTTARKL